MGLKSGSRDAGLDDESEEQHDEPTEAESETAEAAEEQSVDQGESDDAPAETTEAETGTPEETESETETEPETASETESNDETDSSGTSNRLSRSSLPYKLRRERVNEGREQVPYFLREEIIKGEDALQTTLEDLLGEKVYKSDYREAAMVVAQRNPGLIADVLREWGYDLE